MVAWVLLRGFQEVAQPAVTISTAQSDTFARRIDADERMRCLRMIGIVTLASL